MPAGEVQVCARLQDQGVEAPDRASRDGNRQHEGTDKGDG